MRWRACISGGTGVRDDDFGDIRRAGSQCKKEHGRRKCGAPFPLTCMSVGRPPWSFWTLAYGFCNFCILPAWAYAKVLVNCIVDGVFVQHICSKFASHPPFRSLPAWGRPPSHGKIGMVTPLRTSAAPLGRR